MAAVNLKVKVHPVVLFQIADLYERRSQENHRVIGTLVGSVDKQCVEVTNCFCIPHKEYEERVEADIVYAQDMFELNKKVAPHEQLVGWFATRSEITSHTALIHDYYARETRDPIHLTLDTTLVQGKVAMKAYVFVPLGVPGATSGSMFTPVQVEMVASEPEIALTCCIRLSSPRAHNEETRVLKAKMKAVQETNKQLNDNLKEKHVQVRDLLHKQDILEKSHKQQLGTEMRKKREVKKLLDSAESRIQTLESLVLEREKQISRLHIYSRRQGERGAPTNMRNSATPVKEDSKKRKASKD